LKRRWAVALAVLVTLGACTNDYDQFDFGGGPSTGGSPNGGAAGTAGEPGTGGAPETGGAPGTGGQTVGGGGAGGGATGGSAGQGGELGTGGGSVGGDASGQGGQSIPDATLDVREEDARGANDAPVDADARADALPDVTADAPRDAGPPDVSADATPDAEPDVTVVPDVQEASPPDAEPDVSIDAPEDNVAEAAPPDVSVDAACAAGTKLCGGTCVSMSDPAFGCSAISCAACAVPSNSTGVVCGGTGSCAIAGCLPGFDDCNSLVLDGCETSIATNTASCGQCGRACSGQNVGARICAGGVCVPSCTLGFSSCNAPAAPNPDDGCETPAQSANGCGSCGNDCTAQGVAGGFVCSASSICGCPSSASCGGVAGACSLSGLCSCNGLACQTGESCVTTTVPVAADAGDVDADDGSADDADIDAGTTQVDNCSCNGASACSAGQTCCQNPAGCSNLATDSLSCGACGRACPLGFQCIAGACHCQLDGNCNGGSSGTCVMPQGQCSCSAGGVCDPGRRCQPNGSCG
jgi:hypothetical protein